MTPEGPVDPADPPSAGQVPAAPAPPPPPDVPGAWTDVLVPWALGLGVLWGTARLAALGGFLAEAAGTITAAYFLLVPLLVARRRGLDPVHLGLHAGRLLRSLAWALAVAVVVFPPYLGLFAGWARWVEDRPLQADPARLADFPALVRGRPPLASPPQALLAWTEGDALHVLNASGGPLDAVVEGCTTPPSGLVRRDGRLLAGETPVQPASDGTVRGRLARDQGWRCGAGGPGVRVAVDAGDDPVPLAVGEAFHDAGLGPLETSRTPWWILELLAIHLLVVALPEEAFYRGLAQTRLAGRFRRRFRILGADLGGEVLLASALFALSHLVAIPAPFRLAVFVPGLLFGWLRVRTGSVVAPAVLHALSNVLLAVLVRMQGG